MSLVMDHIGVAVAELDAALAVWRDQLGMPCLEIEDVANLGVRVAILDSGPTKTELLEPLGTDSTVGKFLAAGRKGIHHVAYRTTEIDAVLARLRAAGVRLIHEHAVPGSRGTRVAFIHPASCNGVLVELVEYPVAKGGGH